LESKIESGEMPLRIFSRLLDATFEMSASDPCVFSGQMIGLPSQRAMTNSRFLVVGVP
jgi:hypothetical protein